MPRPKYKRRFIQKVTEVEEVSGRINGLRKQDTEAKKGSLELNKEGGKGNTPWGQEKGQGRGVGMLPEGRESMFCKASPSELGKKERKRKGNIKYIVNRISLKVCLLFFTNDYIINLT